VFLTVNGCRLKMCGRRYTKFSDWLFRDRWIGSLIDWLTWSVTRRGVVRRRTAATRTRTTPNLRGTTTATHTTTAPSRTRTPGLHFLSLELVVNIWNSLRYCAIPLISVARFFGSHVSQRCRNITRLFICRLIPTKINDLKRSQKSSKQNAKA